MGSVLFGCTWGPRSASGMLFCILRLVRRECDVHNTRSTFTDLNRHTQRIPSTPSPALPSQNMALRRIGRRR